ncbi:uncharacterized protein AB675_914 [Cyphellophora attinorum]|uniref:HD domain-containing protein n=1 Tax=Cyphellophora attinorum TaxID=1664694 RepID=A0A0N1P3K7_9EURO|nr:uncharacterized protein AB675_914 [Phialophora attinorum]KPI45696.1 hypothetical protein AB675_914 [Phialophora attinorum]
MANTTLPTAPIAGITFPITPLTKSALAHIQTKNIPSTVNHTVRSAIFALIIASKHPGLSTVDHEAVATAILLHDLGWSKDPDCRSRDKRFEVDGAIAAKNWLASSVEAKNAAAVGGDLNAIWYAIALHTTPSVSLHSPDPVVVATALGIVADFLGPHTPGGLITEEEFKEVLAAYPRVGFKEDMLEIMCGLCREKPETTFDNFVGDIGRKWVEGYEEQWERRRFERTVWKVLEGNGALES